MNGTKKKGGKGYVLAALLLLPTTGLAFAPWGTSWSSPATGDEISVEVHGAFTGCTSLGRPHIVITVTHTDSGSETTICGVPPDAHAWSAMLKQAASTAESMP